MALKDLVVVAAAAEWRNGGCFKGWKRMLSLSLCIIHGHIIPGFFCTDLFVQDL